MTTTQNKRGAPLGNRNHAKEQPGIRGTFYLNAADLEVIDAALVLQLNYQPTNAERLTLARLVMHIGLRNLRDRHHDETPIIV